MEPDLIKRFLKGVDDYLKLRADYGKPLTEKSLSMYLFRNTRRIRQLREDVDIGYRRLQKAERDLTRRAVTFTQAQLNRA